MDWHQQLWLGPDADAPTSEVTATITDGTLRYVWRYKGAEQQGVLTPAADGARWQDSWHQGSEVEARNVPAFGALVCVVDDYGPSDEPWHWRIGVCQRPDGTLVVQMTNITPWGEEARAVQMELPADQDPRIFLIFLCSIPASRNTPLIAR